MHGSSSQTGSDDAQQRLCARFGAAWQPAPDDQKVGIATETLAIGVPLNGLRHPPAGDASGWYIWAGEELKSDPEFFKPMHVSHLSATCPDALRFLGLPPGWRFLTAGDYVDVWFDESLLAV
jgi:hypothetical protein